ncbi:hypothetical protein TeGR_g167 [Tetraparma gracilis]|uniref:Uncharacterized protein n=1 Tax=Tetraparma gracilis TaxID=2962635 RepID=A0ABQ6NBQ7_9STRA|nr:hypothetical protein TeGR_g167 [Tetraparma gracilis]
MGCPPGSMCARFQHVEERIMTLYMLNYVDAILELAGAIVTVIYILSNYGGCYKASMFFNRLNVFVLLALDLILQAAVLVVSTDSTIVTDLNDVINSLCWGVTDRVTDRLLNEITGGMEWITVLGFIELVICLIGIASAIWDRLGEDKDKDVDRSVFARMGLAISILAIFFDVVLSCIDFFKFTIASQRDFEQIAESLAGESTLRACMVVEEVAVPRFVVAEDNCFQGEPYAVDKGVDDWVIAVVVSGCAWLGCLFAYSRWKVAKDEEDGAREEDLEQQKVHDEAERKREVLALKQRAELAESAEKALKQRAELAEKEQRELQKRERQELLEVKRQLEASKKENRRQSALLEKKERTEAAGSQNSEVGVAMVSLGASKSVHL